MNDKIHIKDDDLSDIIDFGIMLASEYEIPKLLEKILLQARKMTQSDAGSIYVVESETLKGKVKKKLRFKTAQNDTAKIASEEFVFDIDKKSIAGYVALTGEIISIEDVYEIPDSLPFSFGKGVDSKTGYRTVSMLTFPIKNFKKEVIGVVQLINRKKNFSVKFKRDKIIESVLPYDEHSKRLASFMVSQAGAALENAHLVESIKESFEVQKRLQEEKILAFYDIAAGIADTLINKLSGISMTLEYMQESFQSLGEAAEEFTSMNQDVLKEGRWMIQMVKRLQETTDKDLLALLSDVGLHPLLKEVASDYADKKIELDLFHGNPVIQASPKIGECFKGIIENALESKEGGAEVVIRTKADTATDSILIEIIDNGNGMEEEQIKRVFTPFYTSKGTTRSGLGLWFCYQVITGAGGSISIESQPGNGTVVITSFPLHEKE